MLNHIQQLSSDTISSKFKKITYFYSHFQTPKLFFWGICRYSFFFFPRTGFRARFTSFDLIQYLFSFKWLPYISSLKVTFLYKILSKVLKILHVSKKLFIFINIFSIHRINRFIYINEHHLLVTYYVFIYLKN